MIKKVLNVFNVVGGMSSVLGSSWYGMMCFVGMVCAGWGIPLFVQLHAL